MRRYRAILPVTAAFLVCTASFSVLADEAADREPATQPTLETVRSADDAPAPKTPSPDSETKTWAKWACILAGLALVGVIWVGWSMQTLARNQVQLGRLIQGKEPPGKP